MRKTGKSLQKGLKKKKKKRAKKGGSVSGIRKKIELKEKGDGPDLKQGHKKT